MIDPPWRWRNWTVKHNWRSPEAKYQTLLMEEIAALPIARLMRPGGCAWVWLTWPLVAQQIPLIRHAWGLDVRTGGAWTKRTRNGKQRMGTGFGLRSVCEPFVLAVNGDGFLPRGRSLRNLIESDAAVSLDGLAREHSRKPEEAYAMAEALSPGQRRVDVFSRQDRPGWTPWGLEAGKYNGE